MSKTAVSQTVDPTDTLAVLKAAESWLSHPEHWTHGCYIRRDRDGRVAQTCATGALFHVMQCSDEVVDGPAYRTWTRALGKAWSLSAVNDGPDGYARIMAGLRKAIEDLEVERAA